MAKKPQGGPHSKERKRLLAEHGANYILYQKGKLSELDIRDEVLGLEALGIGFPEIVAAREKALRNPMREGTCAPLA